MSKKLSVRGQKWIKALHIVSACLWIGAAVCLAVKQFFVNPSNDMELYGITSTMHFIDYWIIIPGAVGTFLTAIIYSIWTNWGWFKHNWITVKWIICVYGIAFGTYPMGPWMTQMMNISKEKGLNALTDSTYLHNRNMLYFFGTFQAATLIFAVIISVLKPWKKRKQASHNKPIRGN
jgi:uncharacterized membrane protein